MMQQRKARAVTKGRKRLPSEPEQETKRTLRQPCSFGPSDRVGEKASEALTRRDCVRGSNEHAPNGRRTSACPALIISERADIANSNVTEGVQAMSAAATEANGHAHGDRALARTAARATLDEGGAVDRAMRNGGNTPEQRLIPREALALRVGETARAPAPMANARRDVVGVVEQPRKGQQRVHPQVRTHRHRLHRRDHHRRTRTERIERCRAAVEVGRKGRMGRETTRRCARTKHAINNVRYAHPTAPTQTRKERRQGLDRRSAAPERCATKQRGERGAFHSLLALRGRIVTCRDRQALRGAAKAPARVPVGQLRRGGSLSGFRRR